jgi:dTMP kinase
MERSTIIEGKCFFMTDNSKFISFEGIDFSGKTTQIEHLTNKLQQLGETVTIMREPGGTSISEQIRDILLNKNHNEMTDICEVFLYSAARNQLINEKIIGELEDGNFVIADRYVDSTTAYQGFGRRLPMDLIHDINRAATGDLLPGLTFILDIDPADVVERKKERNMEIDRLESSGDDFYERVHKGYHKIAELDPIRVKLIDASQSIDQIKSEIWEFVTQKMNL